MINITAPKPLGINGLAQMKAHWADMDALCTRSWGMDAPVKVALVNSIACLAYLVAMVLGA